MEWIILSFLTAITISVIVVMSKKHIYDHESIEYSTSIRIFTALLTLPFLFYYIIYIKKTSIYEIGIIYIASIINMIAFWLFFKSIKHMDIHKVSPLLNLETIFIFLFALLLFNETPTVLSLVGIALLITSIFLIEYRQKPGFRNTMKNLLTSRYVLVVIISVIYYSLFKILSRYLLYYQKINFFDFFIFLNIFNAINGILLVSLVETISPLTFFRKYFVKSKIVFLISLLTLLQILTEYAAYVLTPNVAYVASIRMLYVVFAMYLANILLGEKYPNTIYLLSIIAFIGAVFIITG